jgi:hypothetical protein
MRPAVLPLYAAAAEREIELATARGALSPEDASAMLGRACIGLASRA